MLLRIDNRQFNPYSFVMADADGSLNRVLGAVADPTRRRILQALKRPGANLQGLHSGLCAGDIEERVHLSQPTVSHHMAVLTKAGLVQATKQGQWRWYRRNPTAIRALLKKLRSEL